jgi:hypothetical protein
MGVQRQQIPQEGQKRVYRVMPHLLSSVFITVDLWFLPVKPLSFMKPLMNADKRRYSVVVGKASHFELGLAEVHQQAQAKLGGPPMVFGGHHTRSHPKTSSIGVASTENAVLRRFWDRF